MSTSTGTTAVDAGSVEELQRAQVRVVSAGGHTIALFWSEGRVYAVDNRCPHMGFPMSRGSIANGIITCHWHHARFELGGGCTFDPFADDLPTFPVESPGRTHSCRPDAGRPRERQGALVPQAGPWARAKPAARASEVRHRPGRGGRTARHPRRGRALRRAESRGWMVGRAFDPDLRSEPPAVHRPIRPRTGTLSRRRPRRT